MKSLNFLLIPNVLNFYDLNQLEEIKQNLEKYGHQATIFKRKIDNDVITLTNSEIVSFIKENKCDCVFRVNGGRPLEIDKDTRFISWFQDFYYNSDKELEKFNKNDIVYFYTSPKSFGVKTKIPCYSSTFYPGVAKIKDDESIFSISKKENINKYQNIDFSLLGAILVQNITDFNNSHYRNYDINEDHLVAYSDFLDFKFKLDKKEKIPTVNQYKEFICELQNIVELNYEPLSGELDVKKLAEKVKNLMISRFEFTNNELFNGWKRYFSTEYPRVLDRIAMARLISTFSNNFVVVSDGWERVEEFIDYHMKKINKTKDLYRLLKKSKINLFSNTHGLGMHSKVFETMINGGFVAIPFSKKNSDQAGIKEGFIEGEDFGEFDPNKFDEFINNWLFNTKKRILIGENARQKTLSNHTWEVRVKQLLDDLKI